MRKSPIRHFFQTVFFSQSIWNRMANQKVGRWCHNFACLTSHSLLKWKWLNVSDLPALFWIPKGAGIYHQRERSTDLTSWLAIIEYYCLVYANRDTNILNTNYNKPSSLTWPAEQVQKRASKYILLSQTWLLAQFWVREYHFYNYSNQFIP